MYKDTHMEKKTILIIIVAALIALAIVFYHDKMSLTELIAGIIGSASSLALLYQWWIGKEKNEIIKKETGETFSNYKERRK